MSQTDFDTAKPLDQAMEVVHEQCEAAPVVEKESDACLLDGSAGENEKCAPCKGASLSVDALQDADEQSTEEHADETVTNNATEIDADGHLKSATVSPAKEVDTEAAQNTKIDEERQRESSVKESSSTHAPATRALQSAQSFASSVRLQKQQGSTVLFSPAPSAAPSQLEHPHYVMPEPVTRLGYTINQHGYSRSYVPIVYPPREIIDDKLVGVCRAAHRVPEVPSPANVEARLAEYNSTLLYLNAHLKGTEHYYNLPFLRDEKGLVLFLPKGSVLPNVYCRIDNEDQMSVYGSERTVSTQPAVTAAPRTSSTRFAGLFSCCSQPVVESEEQDDSRAASVIVPPQLHPDLIASPLQNTSVTVTTPIHYHYVEERSVSPDGYVKQIIDPNVVAPQQVSCAESTE